MELPKKVNDKWHKLAQQMIQMNGGCIDIAHDKDDPQGSVHRYVHLKSPCGKNSVLYLASKMRRTALEKP